MALGFLELLVLLVLGLVVLSVVSPSTRKAVFILLGVLLAVAGAVLLTRAGLPRMFGLFGNPGTWFLLGFLTIAGLAIAAVVALIVNPKTRPWGIGLVVAGPVLLVGFLGLIAMVHWDVGTPVVLRAEDVAAEKIDASETAKERADDVVETPKTPEQPAETSDEKTTEPAKGAPEEVGQSDKPAEEAPAATETPADDRPDWVDAPPGMVNDQYQCAAAVGPYTTRMECDRAMAGELRRAVADYVDLYLGREARRRVRLPDDYVSRRIIRATWEETKQTSVGRMKQVHVLLTFDRKTNDLIKQRLHESQVEDRIVYAGIGLGCVLFVLLLAYGVLKITIATTHKTEPRP